MRSICYKLRGFCRVYEKIDPPSNTTLCRSVADKVSKPKRPSVMAGVNPSRFLRLLAEPRPQYPSGKLSYITGVGP